MKRTLLIPVLLICQIVFAQKAVTNLHYVWTEHFQSPKKTDVNERYRFNFNWNPDTKVFVSDKTKTGNDKVYPRHIIDMARKIIVVQMEKRNEYVLEETDSFFVKDRIKLEPVEGTKTIKGFTCRGYSFKSNMKLMSGAPGPAPVIKEEFTIWVTDELTWNNELNPYVLALVRSQSAEGVDFTGVIVELDYKMMYGDKTWNNIIELDVAKLDQKPEAITWPWEMKDGVAWLEQTQLNSGYTILLHDGWDNDGDRGGVYRKGDGNVHKMNARLKALLQKTTGQEKPKTKPQYFQNVFGLGPWGN